MEIEANAEKLRAHELVEQFKLEINPDSVKSNERQSDTLDNQDALSQQDGVESESSTEEYSSSAQENTASKKSIGSKN